MPPSNEAKIEVCDEESFPVTVGLPFVLAITASIFCSIRQLKAAAAPDTKLIPIIEANKISTGTIPGVAKNIPITAVNTIKAVTLGLHKMKKFFKSICNPDNLLFIALAINLRSQLCNSRINYYRKDYETCSPECMHDSKYGW